MNLTSALESVYAENGILDPAAAPAPSEFAQVVGDVVSGQELARCEARQTTATEEAADLVRSEQVVQEVHEHINAAAVDGKVSLESYIFAKHALCTTRLGRAVELPIGPSLESIVNTDDVTVSQEAIGDLVKGVGDIAKNGLKRLSAEATRAHSYLTTALTARRRQLAGLVKQLNELEGDASGKTVALKPKFLTRNGKIIDASNAVTYARESFGTLTYCTQNFLEEAMKASESNGMLIDAINTESDAAFKAGLKALVRGWKDPRAKLIKGGKQVPMPSDIPLFQDRASRYEGNDPSLKFLDDQTNKNRFTHLITEVIDNSKNGHGEKVFQQSQNVQALSKQQMNDIAKSMSDCLHGINRGLALVQGHTSTLRALGGLALDGGRVFSQLAKNGAGMLAKSLNIGSTKAHAAEFKVIKDAFAYNCSMGNMLFFDAAVLAQHTSFAMMKYLRASIQAHKSGK